MGFNNPSLPWSELERILSDRPIADGGRVYGDTAAGWRHRTPYEPPSIPRRATGATTPYAELHCHSNFSFLDGASRPEELAEEAARLGLTALAVTDHDGMYGVVRFAEAARAIGLRTVFGAELTLGLTRFEPGLADPEGDHLVVLARDPHGYARLCRAITSAQMAGGEKNRPTIDLGALVAIGSEGRGGDHHHWHVLTGCRKGSVPRALVERGPAAAAYELARLVDAFGRDHVAVELWDHGDPLDSARNDALVDMAAPAGLDLGAPHHAHYATPPRRPLAPSR